MSAFALNVLSHVIRDSLCCGDDAAFSLVAKNLADGNGYTNSYPHDPAFPGHLRAFDPAITVGPTLILPAALAVRVLGNTYWAPGLTTALISLLCIVAIFLLGRPIFESLGQAVAAGTLFILWVNALTVGYYEQWYALLGEIPAALLVILALSLLARRSGRHWQPASAGLALGLAVLTKVVSVLALLVAAIPVLWGLTEGRCKPAVGVDRRWRRASLRGVLLLSGLVLPIAGFEIYTLSSLGLPGYVRHKEDQRAFMEDHGSSGLGLLSAVDPLAAMGRTRRHNRAQLGTYLGGAGAVRLHLVVGLLLVVVGIRGRTGPDRLTLLLILAFWTHFLWWLFLSPTGWIRHLLPALFFFSAALALACSQVSASRLRTLILMLALAAHGHRLTHLEDVLAPRPWFREGERVAAMVATANYLEAHADGRPLVADWWASAVDLEYLMDSLAPLTHSKFLPELEDGRCLLLVRNDKWIGWDPGVRARWDRLVNRPSCLVELARPPYSVHRCCETPASGAPPT